MMSVLRYAVAVLAGIALALAFPSFNIAGFAWVAPGVLLAAALGTRGWHSFRIGYVGGLAYVLSALHWLLYIPFPSGAIAGWLALSAYVALYPATWVWLAIKIRNSTFAVQGPDAPEEFLGSGWFARTRWALSCAVIWVALEMMQARFLSGFPWNLLGASQFKLLPLIQITSVTGLYGLAFLIIWFSVSLLSSMMVLIRKPSAHRAWLAEIILPLVVAAAVMAWGQQRLTKQTLPSRELKVALVQPSIPQLLIFDPEKNPERFRRIMQLSIEALSEKPDLLVWPEASLPSLSEENFSAITNMVASHKVWMILGADDAEFRPNETNYYNASFFFGPDGNYVETYRKLRLVIFGEYVPFEKWLPFMKYLTPIDGSFSTGKGPVQFILKDPQAKVAPLICFEDMFPHYTREYVDDDTDFLLNLTNDGWFGESSEQWQHAMNALFRAVENGVPLVRCTNNGLTCWIDEFGRVRQMFRGASGGIYEPGYMIARIPLNGDLKRPPTFYRKYGDVFGWGCVAAAVLIIVNLRFRKQPISEK